MCARNLDQYQNDYNKWLASKLFACSQPIFLKYRKREKRRREREKERGIEKDSYWVTQKIPQIYTANHATSPIKIRKITVHICGNFWITQYYIKVYISLSLSFSLSFSVGRQEGNNLLVSGEREREGGKELSYYIKV